VPEGLRLEVVVIPGPGERPVTPALADELAAAANELAVAEGPTDRVMGAIAAAVQAARAVLGSPPSVAGQRRLSETLWRQAAGLATAGDLSAAVGPARESIDLARQAVRATRADDRVFDAVCGEFGRRANDLSQVLGAAGYQQEAQRLIAESAEVTSRSDGPITARAAAGTRQIMVSGAIDAAVRSLAEGQPPPVDPVSLVTAAENVVSVLRRIAREDDPTTIFDLAQGLHMLGRACMVGARMEQAAGALTEAQAIFARFDGEAARGQAAQVRAELDLISRSR
jgi:hypothetical protein